VIVAQAPVRMHVALQRKGHAADATLKRPKPGMKLHMDVKARRRLQALAAQVAHEGLNLGL
jgi:hypothetical protein